MTAWGASVRYRSPVPEARTEPCGSWSGPGAEAEEFAEISNNLFLPEGTEDFLRERRGEPEHG